MNAPGLYNLGVAAIAAAQTSPVILTQGNIQGAAAAYLHGLDGMLSATLYADFIYGSGGTSLAALVQTSFDGGETWLDVARFDFVQASRIAVANLSGLLSKAVTTYAALSAEGVNDGVLGPLWRASYTSVGIYAGNTRLSLRLGAR